MKLSRITTRTSPAIVLLGLIIIMSACANKKAEKSHTLMTSIAPLTYMVERIAGEKWDVSPLVPAGYSPEDYTPTAARMASLSSARMVFIAGNLPVETTWIMRAAKEVKTLECVNTSTGMKQATFDPHTWLSPRSAKVIYGNICAALCRIDSTNAPIYRKRYTEAVGETDSLDMAIREILKNAPSRAFVIVHPALTMFAEEYGLTQLAIEKDGKEPTPRSMEALIQQARKQGAKVVLLQKEFAESAAQVVARQIDARVVEIDPLSSDWPAQMIHIAKAIANG